MTQDLNTLICLFHHQKQAQAALEEVLQAGIPEANVVLIGGPGSQIASSRSTLLELNVPERDVEHLLDGVSRDGALLAVSAISAHADEVEAIFARHKAGKIDESEVADDMSAQALPYAGSTAGMDLDSMPTTVAAAPVYDPLMPAELEQEGDDLVLVSGTVDADGVAYIDSVQPIQSAQTYDDDANATRDDVDPRELGLDARMNPSARGQVQ